MYSDDVYRSKLRATLADLRAAVAPLDGHAKVSVDISDQSCRLLLAPLTAGACPLELMLRADQHYDIALGSQLYEDKPIERLELFQPLLKAVIDGAVVERRYSSALTAIETGREIIVTLADGSLWIEGSGARSDTQAGQTFTDRRFLPYVR